MSPRTDPIRPGAAGRHVGIEVDGHRAAVVLVADANVLAARVVTAAGGTGALERALADIPDHVPVTVSVVSATQAVRRLSVPAAPTDRSTLVQLVTDHERSATTSSPLTGPGVALAATCRPPAVPQGRWRVLVCAWPAGLVSEAHTAGAARSGSYRVLPSALTAAGGGDLVLALRHSCAELTVSQAGTVVATAALPAGGLDVVEAALGGGDDVGAQRTAEAVAAGGVRDPLAAAELDRWLRDVLTQTQAVCAAWRADGIPVPAAVYVHGPAAAAVTLPFLMDDLGVTRALASPATARALLKVPAAQRPLVVGAYLAAQHPAADAVDLATFDDPDLTGARAAAARRCRRRQRVRAGVATTALLTACALGPAAAVTGYATWLEQRTDAHVAAVARTAGIPADQARRVVDVAASSPVRAQPGAFTPVTVAGAASVPGVTIDSVAAQARGQQVLVTVTGTAPSPAAVAQLTDQWRAGGADVRRTSTRGGTDGSWAFTVELRQR